MIWDLIEHIHEVAEWVKEFVENGLSWATAFAVVLFIAHVKQRYDHRRSNRRIESKIDALLKDRGVTWNAAGLNSFEIMGNLQWKQLRKGIFPARITMLFTRRKVTEKSILSKETNMKAYLKKLGKTKLQAFLLASFINLALLAGYLLDLQDIQSKVDAWMPMANMIIQVVLTIVYQWVEGSIDKASLKATGIEYTTGGQTNAQSPGDTGSAV